MLDHGDHELSVFENEHARVEYFTNDVGQIIFEAVCDHGYEIRILNIRDHVPNGFVVVMNNNNVTV